MTQRLKLNVTGFVDGLNTEASIIGILPSEMMDGSENIELLQNGEAKRRKGFDFIGESDDGQALQLLRTSSKEDELRLESPSCVAVRLTAPNGDIVERLVADINNDFYIYELTSDALSHIDSPYQVLDRDINSATAQKFFNIQFASSGNRLYFTGLYTNPGYLKVAANNIDLELVFFDVIIRDPNATGANQRVSNGGKWYECIETHTRATADNAPGSGTNWQRYWFQLEGALPTSPAPTAWADAASYTSTLIKQYNKRTTATDSDTFPTSVEFYAGRVWLTGDPKNPNALYFSKVIVGDTDHTRYMQFADPFDASDPDVVEDDGGVIKTQGMALSKRMVAAGTSMFVGANNGVWQISGTDGIFKATQFSNHKILTDGIDGVDTMVRVEREVMIFGQHAIWRSVTESSSALVSTISGAATMVDVSSKRIRTIYNEIPVRNKASARALYNATEQTVLYFFNRERTEFDKLFNLDDQPGYYTNMLILDSNVSGGEALDFNAGADQDKKNKRYVQRTITMFSFADEADQYRPYISAPFITTDIPAVDEPVVVDGEPVIDGDGDAVLAAGTSSATETLLFLAMRRTAPDADNNVNIYVAFGTSATSSLLDWASDERYYRGYSSRVVSGVQTLGDVSVKKSATYMYFVFKKLESGVLDADGFDLTPGGCNMRTAWNFAVNTTSAKYGAQHQIYVPDRYNYSIAGDGLDGHNYTWFKHRARGRGNVLMVVLESDEQIVDADGELVADADGEELYANSTGKDFHIVGWTQTFYGKQE